MTMDTIAAVAAKKLGKFLAKDFREMQAQGFTPTDVQEITGYAAYVLMNTIFTTVANTALSDE